MTSEDFKQQLPGLVKNYKPAEDVLEQLSHISLLMIIGPSGVGKTTIINETGLRYVPSDNTRAKRPEEVEGVDYYFRDDYGEVVNEIKQGRFVQVAIDGDGDFKATRAEFYPAAGWATMAVVADAIPTFRSLGFEQTVSAFIVPPTYKEWMRRMDAHRLTLNQLQKRFAEAERSLKFALKDPEMHFILADKIVPAVNQLAELLQGKPDQAREQKARIAAEQNLAKLTTK